MGGGYLFGQNLTFGKPKAMFEDAWWKKWEFPKQTYFLQRTPFLMADRPRFKTAEEKTALKVILFVHWTGHRGQASWLNKHKQNKHKMINNFILSPFFLLPIHFLT